MSILHLQREYLKKLGQSIGMFTNLCLLLRLPLADAVFSSVTCSEIHFLSPCNLCCYLQVVLYKLKPRARFHCRFTSHTRFVGQKPSPVNGPPLHKLVDSITQLLRASRLLCVSANQNAHHAEILSNMIIWFKEKIPHCWSGPLWKYDIFFNVFDIAN